MCILKKILMVCSHESMSESPAPKATEMLIGPGFASLYRLHPIASFKRLMGRCKATIPSFFSLTSNWLILTANLLDRQRS